jgi:uncharacterized membrane protein YhaH (DUF805 family)
MEDLFEFMFGASGRINRATYWRSLVVFGVAGLFAAVLLLTAASLAAPLFIVTVVVVFLPWLMWGFAIHTERLHDRNKSAWWLVTFYLVPSMLGHLAKIAWSAGAIGTALQPILPLAAFALSIWGFVESAACLAPRGRTDMVPTQSQNQRAELRGQGFSILLMSAEGDETHRAPLEAASQLLKRWPS